MAFQKGNKFGSGNGKTWHWRETIERAITQDDGKLMRRAADQLLRHAASGDITAIKELGDRLDGKAHQSVAITPALPIDLDSQDAMLEAAKRIALLMRIANARLIIEQED